MAHNLADLFEHAADAYGHDRLAVVERDRRLHYADLEALANQWAAVLADLGVQAGSHVGVQLRNGVDCMALIVGVLKLRAIPVSVNYRYTGPELAYLYQYCDITVLVYHREFGGQVAAAVHEAADLRHILVVDDGSEVTDAPEGVLEAADLVASASPQRQVIERSGDDMFLIITGGTTGMPKGVMWRHEDLWRSLGGGSDYQTGEPVPDEYHQSQAGLGGEPLRYLVLLPLIHTSGLMPTFTALFSGGTCHFLPHFDPSEALDEIEQERIQVVIVAGDAMVRPLLEDMRSREVDTSSMFMVSSGAAQFSPTMKKELLDLRPDLMIMDGFGSSEGGFGGLGMVTKANVDDGSLFAHHGPRIPLSSSIMLVDDLDELLPRDSTEVGWIVKTGYLPTGYYKDPVKTANTFRVIAGQRRVFTGDRGQYDGDSIIMLGRANQVINSGGEKVFAEEVEAALKAVDGIEDAVVLGVPDERFGQRVAAVVQVNADPDFDAVDTALRAGLAGYKIPAVYWLADTIGRHPSSKIDFRWVHRYVADNAPMVDRRTKAHS